MSDDQHYKHFVGARMTDEMVERLDALRPLLVQLPEYAGSRLSRAALVRIAVAHGLERLTVLLRDRVDAPEQVDLLENRQESLDVGNDA